MKRTISNVIDFLCRVGWVICLAALISACKKEPDIPRQIIIPVGTSNTYELIRTNAGLPYIWMGLTGTVQGTSLIQVDGLYEIPIHGSVGFAASYDWFSTNCRVTYLPINITTGHLYFYYIFR